MADAREVARAGRGMTRRDVLAGVPLTLAARAALGQGETPKDRPRVAAIVTEYRGRSHGQGIVDRFLDGYGWESRHHRPKVDVVALYLDQKPAGDLSRERAQRHPDLKIYPTIAEALRCGGPRLAVDGVLSIGEHGRYPRNEKRQQLYPRYQFFQQIVDVFRTDGRAVPVFNDKHLSWNWAWAKEMVEAARGMGFAFMAGSSLPVTWRLPAVDVPAGAPVTEAVCVAFGGLDSYDFHGLETIQCMVERRRGGETGVAAVQLIRGEAVWKGLGSGSWAAGGCDPELFEACLCRSFTLSSPRTGYGSLYPELGQLPALVRNPMQYRIEYKDGLKATLFLLNGLVRDFTVALRIGKDVQPLSTQMYLPGFARGQTLSDFFNPLAHHIEEMFLTGKPPYPIERTLLTTGILAAAIDSLYQGHKRIETPDLGKVHYTAPRESTYRQT
jgi:hypothetical protein